MSSVLLAKTAVRGYHVYQVVWKPRHGDLFVSLHESENRHDRYAGPSMLLLGVRRLFLKEICHLSTLGAPFHTRFHLRRRIDLRSCTRCRIRYN